MKDRNTSWVKYAVFLTFLALILSALVFWLCAYLDSQSDKAPSNPTPPVEDGSEFPDGSAIVPDGSSTIPDGSMVISDGSLPSVLPEGSEMPALPDNPEDPFASAKTTYEMILEIEKGQLIMRSTDRADWITADQFDQIDEGMLCSDAIAILGQPHFIYPGSFGPTYVYVADDGSVYEFFVNSPIIFKEQIQPIRLVVHYPSHKYANHIENALASRPIVSGNPDETVARIHDEIMSCLYMYQNERIDYPTMKDAKKIYVDMSASEVEEILGKPHYIQMQEERPLPNSGPLHVRFYVLSNGVLMAIGCSPKEDVGGIDVTFFNVNELDKFLERYLKFKEV